MNHGQVDQFGYDPAIRQMRRIFSQLEAASKELLSAAGISPFDPRLRRWREAARELFERGWAKAAQRNMPLTADEAGILYALALKSLMERDGIPASALAAFVKQDARTLKIAELVP